MGTEYLRSCLASSYRSTEAVAFNYEVWRIYRLGICARRLPPTLLPGNYLGKLGICPRLIEAEVPGSLRPGGG